MSEKTHRELYPGQYEHPLCGRLVAVVTAGRERARGVVERVVPSRFGPLALLQGGPATAWPVAACRLAEESSE
jgi:hypothetical protein